MSGVFHRVERGTDEERGDDADHRERAKDSPVQVDHVWQLGIRSINETGLNVEDFDRWLLLDHQWMKGVGSGCASPTSTSRSEEKGDLKAGFIRCKRSLTAVSNPEETNQHREP